MSLIAPTFLQPAPLPAARAANVSLCRSRHRRRVVRRPRVCAPPRACIDAASLSPADDPAPAPPGASAPLPAARARAAPPLAASLWAFSRPHTIYGTVVAVLSLTLVARLAHPLPLAPALLSFLTALVPALLINVYIVGLNQLCDVHIDRINKPFLPVAAGHLSRRAATRVVALALAAGLAFCAAPRATPALRVVLLGSAALGTLYSAPPFRLKRFALLASAAILVVRGVLINVAFFAHAVAAAVPAAPPPLPLLVRFATAFFMAFGVVIALLKDAPDIRGDRVFGIRTFSVRLGAKPIFRACVAALVAMFSIASVFYFRVSTTMAGGVLAATTHLLVAGEIARRAVAVDTDSSEQIYRFYMFTWKAFYFEYLLLPLAIL